MNKLLNFMVLTMLLCQGTMSAQKKLLVLDVDPGTDDGIALYISRLLPSQPTHLVATFGNQALRNTHKNLVLLKKEFGLSGEVVLGAEKPRSGALPSCGSFHGEDGLAGLQDSLARAHGITKKSLSAYMSLDELADEILKSEECVYVAVGPLTSLAYLLEKYDLGDHIQKVLVMGGGIEKSNHPQGYLAEYNFAGDGESVCRVFASDLDITLFPLDITESDAKLDWTMTSTIMTSDVPNVVKRLITQNFISNTLYTEGCEGGAAVLHDCLPVLSLMDSAAFDYVDLRLKPYPTGRIHEESEGRLVVHVAKAMRNKDLLLETILK